jgi:hypothetical protein
MQGQSSLKRWYLPLKLNHITSDFFYQLMHYLLDNKMLKFKLKCYTVAPTCFGLLCPSSGNLSLSLTKVTLCLYISSIRLHRHD